jgi:alcohol dehydrogenase (quinone), cytochrome c subunit
MTDDDALAAAKYLKSILDKETQTFVYDETVHRALQEGDTRKAGSVLYLDNCAACHRPDGLGYKRVFPQLAGNPVVMAPKAISLASIILDGSLTPKTSATPAQFAMPSFAWRLNDQEVADIVNFIRSSWGNKSAPIAAGDVAKLRKPVRYN